MRTTIFPDPKTADENGIVCVGGKLSAPLLVEAYKQGIFPWPDSDYPEMLWFSPDPRGVLDLKAFHLSKSLKKWAKKTDYQIVLNKDFKPIVEACATASRPHQSGTWITKDIIGSYSELFDLGLAYCLGVYESDKLVAGIYGVCIDRFVSAESMFHSKTNTSKLAIWALVDFLGKQGQGWIDIQMVTPITAAFGGKEMVRNLFLQETKKVLKTIHAPVWWDKGMSINLTV